MLAVNGQVVGTNSPQVDITAAQYNQLTDTEKNNGTNYYIIDADAADHTKLNTLLALFGSRDILASLGDGTVMGAIQDLNTRMGHFTFNLDPSESYIVATNDPTDPSNTITGIDATATDSEKIDYLISIIGDPTKLAGTGYDSIATALQDMYKRLCGLSFNYNSSTNTIQITQD